MMRKKIVVFLALFFALYEPIYCYAATNLGTLSCWYAYESDGQTPTSQIGRWNNTSLKIKYNDQSNDSSYILSSYVSSAASQWGSALGVSISSSSSYASASIYVYAGTKSNMESKSGVNMDM